MENEIGHSLLAWYRQHKRDLPWRETTDPYKIWISEIMLQQTQVQTVIPYYERWLRRFPDIASLAAAPQGQVLKAWQGLGYYARAKNLHKAAREIMERHAGVFPHAIDSIRELPGIGDYTAGAIASIAFDEAVCAVDVNVLRVGARVLALRADMSKAAVKKTIGDCMQSWIPRGQARDFNQALMELGALVCLPAKPNCLLCPIRPHCMVAKTGQQETIPEPKPAKKIRKLTVVAGILQDRRGRILIQQRPAGGLMGNLWEFPGGKREKGETLQQALQREWQEELGVGVIAQKKFMALRHAYTTFDVRLHVFWCRLLSGRPKALWAQAIRWVSVQRLDDFAYPSANAKIVQKLMMEKDPARG